MKKHSIFIWLVTAIHEYKYLNISPPLGSFIYFISGIALFKMAEKNYIPVNLGQGPIFSNIPIHFLFFIIWDTMFDIQKHNISAVIKLWEYFRVQSVPQW